MNLSGLPAVDVSFELKDLLSPIVGFINGFITANFKGYEVFLIGLISIGLAYFTKQRMNAGLLGWILFSVVWFGALRYFGIGGI